MDKFVSLHNYTHFSLLQSLISPKDFFIQAKELGQKAIAITDTGSLASSWDSLKASRDTDVKLIIGCEFYFRDSNENKDQKPRFIVLLAKNYIGYRNLLHLNNDGFNNSIMITKKVFPVLDWSLLEKYSDGIICLTGCGNGIIGSLINEKNFDGAEDTIKKLLDIYGSNLGAEVQTHNLIRQANNFNIGINQQFINAQVIKLAEKYNIKVVPTNATRYLKKEQSKIHDTLLAVGSMQPVYSNARLKFDTSDLYLKSYNEVKTFFSRNYSEEFADKICENTIYFSELCEKPDWIEPKFSNPGGKELPVFPIKNEKDYIEFCEWMNVQSNERKSLDEDKNFLRFRCEKELIRSGLKYKDEYIKRFEEELDVLYYCGVSSYLLITADFMNWARNNDVPVGPGRGCLTGDAKVLSTNGFKLLKDIKVGDEVFTHIGNKQKVLNTFKYKVKEKLLKIKTENSFDDITLTKDHEVYGEKCIITNKFKISSVVEKKYYRYKKYETPVNPKWIESKDLNINDFIYTSFPKRIIKENNLIKSFTIKYSSTHNSKLDKSIDIIFDNEFIYWLGRLIGDGWWCSSIKSSDSYKVGLAFNSNDKISIEKYLTYWERYGFKLNPIKHKTKNLVQIIIYNKDLVVKLKEFIPDYMNKSSTKHLPIFFRDLKDEQLKYLINGLIDSRWA